MPETFNYCIIYFGIIYNSYPLRTANIDHHVNVFLTNYIFYNLFSDGTLIRDEQTFLGLTKFSEFCLKFKNNFCPELNFKDKKKAK